MVGVFFSHTVRKIDGEAVEVLTETVGAHASRMTPNDVGYCGSVVIPVAPNALLVCPEVLSEI
jgi:hypothetical protein